MGESPRRSVRTAAELRDTISNALDAVVIVTLHDAENRGAVCEEQIRRVMLAVDEYTDHLRNMWIEHHAGRLTLPTIEQVRATGPALTYTHTDGETFTAVDHAPVRSNPRERAISRALITEALRLLNEDDTP